MTFCSQGERRRRISVRSPSLGYTGTLRGKISRTGRISGPLGRDFRDDSSQGSAQSRDYNDTQQEGVQFTPGMHVYRRESEQHRTRVDAHRVRPEKQGAGKQAEVGFVAAEIGKAREEDSTAASREGV